ncbi:ribonuclease H-like domain, reverse transcriptase, RNA-dependent DNA polymerase [Tanacetum coccineum]
MAKTVGIRQAPRAWNIKLDNTLKSLDFKKCALEQAIYTRTERDSILLVGVYVDDLIITGTPKKEIDKFKDQMKEIFEMSDLGLLAYYLGIEVTQSGGDISIKQSAYARKILKEAGMLESNETIIPMDPGTRLMKTAEGTMVNSTEYRSLIGCLRYLLHTRPDLSYSVGLLSRFMQEPKEQHMKAIKKVLRYVKGTKDYGIAYKHNEGNKIYGYSDGSYGVNTQEGKGTTDIIFYYGESPISWSTQKQATVALSSCESEFIAAIAAATQALWLKRLLSRLTHSDEEKITILVDNKSAIALMKNPVFHGRSKHIDTKYHFIRECVGRDDIHVEFKFRSNTLPAIRIHGKEDSQRKTWFNILTLFYNGSKNDKTQRPDSFATYGNGDPVLEDDAIEDCLRIVDEECVITPWKKGDVMLVNNLMVLHARQPLLKPPRRVLYSDDYDEKDKPIPFRRRMFPSCLDGKRITGKDVEYLIESKSFKKLDDDDAVSLYGWDDYPWGLYVWPTLYYQLRDANVKRWLPLYATEPTNEDDKKLDSIFGFTWAFKTWILEVFRLGWNEYYTRHIRYPRIVVWTSNKKFYRPMLRDFLHDLSVIPKHTSCPPVSTIGKARCQRIRPTPNWQPPIPSHPGDAGLCDPIVTTSRYVVPTGRVNVPAGRYVVPTGKDKFIVSAGRTKVIPAVLYNLNRHKDLSRVGPTPLFQTMLVQGQILHGEGSTIPVKSHHTPTVDPSTSQPHHLPTLRDFIRQEIGVPHPSSPTQTHVANKAASTGVDVRHRGAATTTKKVYGAAYTKLIKKVKRLEDKLNKSRRKCRLVLSEEKDSDIEILAQEDPS